MIDRVYELEMINSYVRNNDIKKGPIAFVAKSVQTDIPDRVFSHSNVVSKRQWPNRWLSREKGVEK